MPNRLSRVDHIDCRQYKIARYSGIIRALNSKLQTSNPSTSPPYYIPSVLVCVAALGEKLSSFQTSHPPPPSKRKSKTKIKSSKNGLPLAPRSPHRPLPRTHPPPLHHRPLRLPRRHVLRPGPQLLVGSPRHATIPTRLRRLRRGTSNLENPRFVAICGLGDSDGGNRVWSASGGVFGESVGQNSGVLDGGGDWVGGDFNSGDECEELLAVGWGEDC